MDQGPLFQTGQDVGHCRVTQTHFLSQFSGVGLSALDDLPHQQDLRPGQAISLNQVSGVQIDGPYDPAQSANNLIVDVDDGC